MTNYRQNFSEKGERPQFFTEESLRSKKFVITGDMFIQLQHILNNYHENTDLLFYKLGILQGYINLQGIEELKEDE